MGKKYTIDELLKLGDDVIRKEYDLLLSDYNLLQEKYDLLCRLYKRNTSELIKYQQQHIDVIKEQLGIE